MTQRPFSRPGAIDLSALKRSPATSAPGPAAAPGQASSAGDAAIAGPYAVHVDEQNFQSIIEASMSAPVLLAFFSRTQMPESGTLADDLVTVSSEVDGRLLVGLVDIDAVPQIAQAMQIPSVPLVVAVLDGRPMPLLQDVVGLDELRGLMNQLLQQLTAQGMTGRHQPRTAAPADEPDQDPRYAAADDALAAGDIDLAVSEYQKLVAGNPADVIAATGLAMAQLLQRTQGVDLNAARAAAAAAPDDLAAQIMVADLDLLGGHVDDAFNRLIDLVRRTAGDDRSAARDHLLKLFSAVGDSDDRVRRGRQNLASALF